MAAFSCKYLSLSFCWKVVEWNQKKVPDESLSSKPDSYEVFEMGIGGSIFFTKQF
jgi:hypothetical protein